jgi:hypothetical protein
MGYRAVQIKLFLRGPRQGRWQRLKLHYAANL